jgi:hypothetical protein
MNGEGAAIRTARSTETVPAAAGNRRHTGCELPTLRTLAIARGRADDALQLSIHALPERRRLQFAWRDVRGRCGGRGALGTSGTVRTSHWHTR